MYVLIIHHTYVHISPYYIIYMKLPRTRSMYVDNFSMEN